MWFECTATMSTNTKSWYIFGIFIESGIFDEDMMSTEL